MAASTVWHFLPFVASHSSSADKLCFKPSPPFSTSKLNPLSIRVSRPKFFDAALVAPRSACRVFRVHGLVDDDSVASPEPESGNSEAVREFFFLGGIDLSLPRRSLLVQFTCDLCGEKTKRLVNRLAYERGAIFVQCAGCFRHHKLVDNLGLITEYDFREKTNMDSETDQV